MASQASYGVAILGSSNNVIGTDGDDVNDTTEGNVISGNTTDGILLESSQSEQSSNDNVIAGNLVGTSARWIHHAAERPGRYLFARRRRKSDRHQLDGVSDSAEHNLISGNTVYGIFLGGSGSIVAGNFIGTNPFGGGSEPNGIGIKIQGASDNVIGGAASLQQNIISGIRATTQPAFRSTAAPATRS